MSCADLVSALGARPNEDLRKVRNNTALSLHPDKFGSLGKLAEDDPRLKNVRLIEKITGRKPEANETDLERATEAFKSASECWAPCEEAGTRLFVPLRPECARRRFTNTADNRLAELQEQFSAAFLGVASRLEDLTKRQPIPGAMETIVKNAAKLTKTAKILVDQKGQIASEASAAERLAWFLFADPRWQGFMDFVLKRSDGFNTAARLPGASATDRENEDFSVRYLEPFVASELGCGGGTASEAPTLTALARRLRGSKEAELAAWIKWSDDACTALLQRTSGRVATALVHAAGQVQALANSREAPPPLAAGLKDMTREITKEAETLPRVATFQDLADDLSTWLSETWTGRIEWLLETHKTLGTARFAVESLEPFLLEQLGCEARKASSSLASPDATTTLADAAQQYVQAWGNDENKADVSDWIALRNTACADLLKQRADRKTARTQVPLPPGARALIQKVLAAEIRRLGDLSEAGATTADWRGVLKENPGSALQAAAATAASDLGTRPEAEALLSSLLSTSWRGWMERLSKATHEAVAEATKNPSSLRATENVAFAATSVAPYALEQYGCQAAPTAAQPSTLVQLGASLLGPTAAPLLREWSERAQRACPDYRALATSAGYWTGRRATLSEYDRAGCPKLVADVEGLSPRQAVQWLGCLALSPLDVNYALYHRHGSPRQDSEWLLRSLCFNHLQLNLSLATMVPERVSAPASPGISPTPIVPGDLVRPVTLPVKQVFFAVQPLRTCEKASLPPFYVSAEERCQGLVVARIPPVANAPEPSHASRLAARKGLDDLLAGASPSGGSEYYVGPSPSPQNRPCTDPPFARLGFTTFRSPVELQASVVDQLLAGQVPNERAAAGVKRRYAGSTALDSRYHVQLFGQGEFGRPLWPEVADSWSCFLVWEQPTKDGTGVTEAVKKVGTAGTLDRGQAGTLDAAWSDLLWTTFAAATRDPVTHRYTGRFTLDKVKGTESPSVLANLAAHAKTDAGKEAILSDRVSRALQRPAYLVGHFYSPGATLPLPWTAKAVVSFMYLGPPIPLTRAAADSLAADRAAVLDKLDKDVERGPGHLEVFPEDMSVMFDVARGNLEELHGDLTLIEDEARQQAEAQRASKKRRTG